MAIEDYEVKVLLKYMINVLTNEKKAKVSAERLYYIKNSIYVDNELKKRIIDDENSITNDDVLKSLKKTYKKYDKSKKSHLQKNMEYFSKIYSLDKNTQKVFGYFLRIAESSTFNKFKNDYLHEEGNFSFSILRLVDLLNISVSDTRKAISKLKELKIIDKGTEISSVIKKITREDVNGKKDIINTIIGKKVKTKLKWEDFNHLQKDRDIVLELLKNALLQKKKGINILFYGDVGSGKTEFTKVLSQQLNTNLFFVANEDENNNEMTRKERIQDLYTKIFLPIKKQFFVLFDEAEDIFSNSYFSDSYSSKSYINTLLENNRVPIFWTTNKIDNVDKAFLRRMTYVIKFEALNKATKMNIWKNELKKQNLKLKNKNLIEKLSNKYELSPFLISNAVTVAKLTNNEENIEHSLNAMVKLINYGKQNGTENSINLNTYKLDFINCKNNIEYLTKQIIESNNLNFSLCIYGEPGTGKSAYARYLADQLNLDVILKRASDLISCYVGDTEKNIARAFQEARNKKAMLIFDEADSFLSSRINASKNWEISQVNEMLTQMEVYEYPFVCTTNLIDKLDEASLRRFLFKLQFDFLTPQQVNSAFEHFFGISNANVNIKGLTAGDFATVKRKVDFFGNKNIEEIINMLNEEVLVKKTSALQNTIGF